MEHDRIEKQIELKAPVERVWRALTDYKEFGEWFRVKLDGPFKVGRESTGFITWPGYEHLKWTAVVRAPPASEPEPDSVRPQQPRCSPEARGGIQR